MNKKRIATTLFMAFLSEIANKIVPLVTLHMVAMRLGTVAFGSAQFALWLIDWGVIFTTFGFMQVAPIMLRDASSDEMRSRVATNVIVSRIGLALVAAIAIVVCVRDGSPYGIYRDTVYACGFILLSTALDSIWILLARQRMAIVSAVSIFVKLASVAAISWMVEGPEDSLKFVVITCAVNSLISVTSFLIAAKDIGFCKPSLLGAWNAVRLAFPYALAVLMIVVLEKFDLYLIERKLGLTATGIYSAASKLVTSLTPIIASITTVFYSEMIAHRDRESIYRHLRASLFWVTSICAPIAVGIWMIDHEILRIIFGAEFTGGAHILSLLTLGAIAYSIILIFGFQLLALQRQWLPLLLGLSLGSICGFTSAILLLPYYGDEGVALSSVIGKWCAAVMILISAKKAWSLSFGSLLTAMARPSIPALAMGAIVSLLIHYNVLPRQGLAVAATSVTIYSLFFSLANAQEARALTAALWRRTKNW